MPAATVTVVIPTRNEEGLIGEIVDSVRPYGEVLVVSNDIAERDTVLAVGGNVCSCDSFISMIKGSLTEFERELQRYNRTELKRYRKG